MQLDFSNGYMQLYFFYVSTMEGRTGNEADCGTTTAVDATSPNLAATKSPPQDALELFSKTTSMPPADAVVDSAQPPASSNELTTLNVAEFI